MIKQIPIYNKSVFSTKSLASGLKLYKDLSALGDVIYLKKDKVYAVTSYAAHMEVLNDPETFTAAKSDSAKVAVINESAQEATAKINFFGEEKNITVPKGTSILQALQDQGIDAPFSCQSGVCSTCIAMLTQGEVAMEFTEALDDDEIEEGLILTCQAKCITDEVEVIFER
ncbi:2Fe-2S iron-sulfur cluster-binding protein [Flavobacteriaceae bacterium]|nr:2Fe-2S iron-sulfur cluster-binding protein [Flavobacteriaceae bacterium]